MNLSEAEIQVLAGLHEAEAAGQPTDRALLEQRGERFGAYKEDWSVAFEHLIARGLLRGDDTAYALTPAGQSLGQRCHAERPNGSWYHYERFFAIARHSAAHGRFCERVYGANLCQDGQTDMDCLHDLLARLNLQPDAAVLDLGCGAGGLAEYVADTTAARVTGVDLSEAAIAVARSRGAPRRGRLTFLHGDVNALALPERSFDAVLSIDSMAWITDPTAALRGWVRHLRPGGQLAIVTEQRWPAGHAADARDVAHTPVAAALTALHLPFATVDCTAALLPFWTLARETAIALLDDFARDGATFITDTWLRAADDVYLPAIRAGRIRRYLYHVSGRAATTRSGPG